MILCHQSIAHFRSPPSSSSAKRWQNDKCVNIIFRSAQLMLNYVSKVHVWLFDWLNDDNNQNNKLIITHKHTQRELILCYMKFVSGISWETGNCELSLAQNNTCTHSNKEKSMSTRKSLEIHIFFNILFFTFFLSVAFWFLNSTLNLALKQLDQAINVQSTAKVMAHKFVCRFFRLSVVFIKMTVNSSVFYF